jgi:hypothetical protein
MIRQIVCEITSRILDLPHYLIKTGLIIECIFFFSFQIANNITLSFANAHSSMILFAICKKKNMHSIINRSGSNKNVKSKNPGLYFTNDGVLSHYVILFFLDLSVPSEKDRILWTRTEQFCENIGRWNFSWEKQKILKHLIKLLELRQDITYLWYFVKHTFKLNYVNYYSVKCYFTIRLLCLQVTWQIISWTFCITNIISHLSLLKKYLQILYYFFIWNSSEIKKTFLTTKNCWINVSCKDLSYKTHAQNALDCTH